MIRLDEKVTISYYAEGSRNDLGEPARTLTARTATAKCSLQPRSAKLAYEFPERIRQQERAGLVNRSTHILFLDRSETIADNDVITDSDSNTYSVAAVVSWKTHKEALLRID